VPVRYLQLSSQDCFVFADNIRFVPPATGWYQFNWISQANVIFPFAVSIRNRFAPVIVQRNFNVDIPAVAAPAAGGSLLEWEPAGLQTWNAAGALSFMFTVFLEYEEEIAFDIQEAGLQTTVGYLGKCLYRTQIGKE